MARIKDFTEGLQELELEKLIKIYEQAEKAIQDKIKNSPSLDNQKNKEFLLKQIKAILADLYDPTASFMTDGIKEQKGIGKAQVLESPNPDQNFSLINQQSVKFIVFVQLSYRKTINRVYEYLFTNHHPKSY